jgi:ABC-2 type transport system permease protein
LRRILGIARRDYLAVVRTKAFLFGLVLFPLLFGGGGIASSFLLRSKGDNPDRQIAVLDRTGAAGAAVVAALRQRNHEESTSKNAGLQATPQYEFETVPADGARQEQQRLELSNQVRRGSLHAFIEIAPDALHPRSNPPASVGYYAANGADPALRWLAEAVNNGLRRARLAELGIPEERARDVAGTAPVESMALIVRDGQTGAITQPRKRSPVEIVVPIAMVVLLFMIVMISVAPVLSAVADDKQQRVFEMLLGTATPLELMGGKVLAAVGVSLTSSVFYLIGGLLALEAAAAFGLAPVNLIPWFFVYLVAEVTMLCAMGTALGATCGSPQDAQHLAMPLLLPVIIPMFLFGPILQQPNGPMATAVSLFPLFTPLTMMLRQSLPGGVPAWQPWVGLAGVLIITPLLTWAAARIFRIAILFQGQRPNAAELVRWAVRG